MIRSVPPASGRASDPAVGEQRDGLVEVGGPLVSERPHGPGLEDPIHLVEQHLRRRRPDEEERSLHEPVDEVGADRTERIRVDERHRMAGRQQLVEQEVVLQRMERLEAAARTGSSRRVDGSKLPSIAGTITTSTGLGSA